MTAAASNSPRANTAAITLLAEVFSSHIRAEVLAYMAPRKDTAYSLTELARALGLAVSSVQHECYKLERLHLIIGKREGSSRRYRLAATHPLMPALQHLVLTALGSAAIFEAAVADCDGLTGAILTTDDDDPITSADLVLIGELELPALALLQERIATLFEIELPLVAVSFYAPATWQEYRHSPTPFMTRLRSRKTLATWGITE